MLHPRAATPASSKSHGPGQVSKQLSAFPVPRSAKDIMKKECRSFHLLWLSHKAPHNESFVIFQEEVSCVSDYMSAGE